MILHHYPMSPYSEKIRLMLGYAGIPWQGVISPEMPPRPQLDPLVGGYRRIPVAQDGADIFCDSRLISAEIAARAGLPALDPANCDESSLGLSAELEGDVFWACVTSIPGRQILKQLVRNISILGAYRFIRDRAGVARKAVSKPVPPKQAVALFARHVEELEGCLASYGDFLGGDKPSHLDFAAYHTFWFQRVVGELPMPDNIPTLEAWYYRMGEIGHGEHREVSGSDAFEIAGDSEPRALSEAQAAAEGVGRPVAVGPDDYAMDATEGVLAGADARRWIVARDTEFGRIHVHFPRRGFALR